MKTTRRSLLTMLGLGAAAAALESVDSVGAAPETMMLTDSVGERTLIMRRPVPMQPFVTGNLTVSGDTTLADAPQPIRAYRDDWSYLMGRIDQAKAAGGGTIRLDNEMYYLNQTLDLTGATNVTLMGGRFIWTGADPLISMYFDQEPV